MLIDPADVNDPAVKQRMVDIDAFMLGYHGGLEYAVTPLMFQRSRIVISKPGADSYEEAW